MNNPFTFTIKTISFDENYYPSSNTRITTNFANLARGEKRKENLRATFNMINNRFNALAHWDNPLGDRYSVELDIVSVEIDVEGKGETFPTIEMLKTTVVDNVLHKKTEGIVGNNFSSYVRDYDFSVLLPNHNKHQSTFSIPNNFGGLHGTIFKQFVSSSVYQRSFGKPPVICLSVSQNKQYTRTANFHPVLGEEYLPDTGSLTEEYFKKMGLQVRYFMPANSQAPFAFYFLGDLLNDYSNLELISTISTMETFQKIYRPEIYNANTPAGARYQPNLSQQDHSVTQVDYDREERTHLAIKQGEFAETHFIKPHMKKLTDWCASNEPNLVNQ